MQKKVVFVVGPTAVGKTAVAFALAQKVGGEIVSCDAMQVYREVPIATSHPSSEMMAQIPHHLVGIVSVQERFDVAAYNRLATAAIADIVGRGKTPVVVGGSGLYVQVLLDGLFAGAARDEGLRQQWELRCDQEGMAALYQELIRRDPDAAAKIHPHDKKRLIRALEVCALTGECFSTKKKERTGIWGKYDIVLYALTRPRGELYKRINSRVEEMFVQGLVEEIRKVLAGGLSPTGKQVIAVPEVAGYLSGDYDLARAQYLLQLHTRHYAKRQLTWFRKEKRLAWLSISAEDTVEVLAEKIRRDADL